MYKRFFGLNRNPFELSPDPSFLCPLGKSEEALASIYHAIARRKGFVVLTGEVGTGKTLTVRYLCELWKDRQIPFANIIGPRLSVTDFLSYVVFDLGIKVTEPSKGNLLRVLYQFLLAQFEKGLTTVLIVDEAHQLSGAVLEEIRLLTNFETAQEKLLQILLVGQPELDQKLDSFELRQLKQRIAIRCQLEPLTEDETRSYIERRLALAGADSRASTIFAADTVRAIYHYSAGVPRLVNSICEQALVAAYARAASVIPVEIIDEVAIYFRLRPTLDLRRIKDLSSPVEDTGDLPTKKHWQVESPLDASVGKDFDVDASSRLQQPAEPRSLNSPVNSVIPAGALEAMRLQRERTDNTVSEILGTETEESLARAGTNLSGETEIPEEPTVGVESGNPILEAGPNPQSQFERAPAFSAVSRGAQKSRSYTEPAKDGKGNLEQLKATKESDASKTQPSGTVATRVGMAAHTKEVAKFWQSRGVIPIWVLLFLVLAGGGTHLFHLTAIGDAAAKPAPAFAVPTSSLEVDQKVSSQPVQIAPTSDQLEQKSTATSTASRRKHSYSAERHDRSDRVAPQKELRSNIASALSDSVNAVPPTSKPPEALDDRTVPALDDWKSFSSGEGRLQLPSVAPADPPAPEELNPQIRREQGGRVQPARLISSVPVVYPEVARDSHIQGDVIVQALINERGAVTEMHVVSGPPVLRQAALDALRQWRYKPGILDGQPVPVEVLATIRFLQ